MHRFKTLNGVPGSCDGQGTRTSAGSTYLSAPSCRNKVSWFPTSLKGRSGGQPTPTPTKGGGRHRGGWGPPAPGSIAADSGAQQGGGQGGAADQASFFKTQRGPAGNPPGGGGSGVGAGRLDAGSRSQTQETDESGGAGGRRHCSYLSFFRDPSQQGKKTGGEGACQEGS